MYNIFLLLFLNKVCKIQSCLSLHEYFLLFLGKVLCEKPSVIGDCYGRILMWYFNSVESTCKSFIYSGCHGNGNRFSTKQECLEFCKGKYQLKLLIEQNWLKKNSFGLLMLSTVLNLSWGGQFDISAASTLPVNM